MIFSRAKQECGWYSFAMAHFGGGKAHWFKSLAPLGLPIFCTAFIHHLFFQTFGENNLTLGIYSRDIYIPLAIGALFCLHRMIGNGVQVRFRKMFFVSTLLLVALIYAFLKNYTQFIFKVPHSLLVIVLLFSCFLVLISAFLTTLNFSELLGYARSQTNAVIYLLIAFASLLNYPTILKFFWKQASYLTAKSVYFVYLLFGVPLQFKLTPVSFNLSGGGFAIQIVMGCSGLEGVFFFIFGFSLIQWLEKRGFGWRAGLAYLSGSILLFLLNTIRITSFYFLGIQLKKFMPSRQVRDLIEVAFHNHFGWILYLVGIIIFMRIFRQFESGRVPIESV